MLTQDELKLVLHYDAETGIFTWLDYPLPSGKARRRFGLACIGSVAGSTNGIGYREIRYNGKLYLGHRLAWLYVYGHFPDDEIDHVNGQRDDNRMANLRSASRVQQNGNSKLRSDNALGFKGVCRDRGRFAAYIKIKGKTKYLGGFATPEEAHAEYMQAARETFGDYARSS